MTDLFSAWMIKKYVHIQKKDLLDLDILLFCIYQEYSVNLNKLCLTAKCWLIKTNFWFNPLNYSVYKII